MMKQDWQISLPRVEGGFESRWVCVKNRISNLYANTSQILIYDLI